MGNTPVKHSGCDKKVEETPSHERLEDTREAVLHKRKEARLRELQEKRDHGLALRLANEGNSAAKNHNCNVNQNQKQPVKKYDLSNWNYFALRDTINTSCDTELLEACRHELHRRLEVYHGWKTMKKHEKGDGTNNSAAAPTNPQRYFRLQLVKPKNSTEGYEYVVPHNQTNGKKGWWYAHFDGQYVARQMELHPDKPAALLVEGVDDMQMCELSLEETGLAGEKDAEISENEFEKEWARQGGKPFVRPCKRYINI